MYTVYASYMRPNMSSREMVAANRKARDIIYKQAHPTIWTVPKQVKGVHKGEEEHTYQFHVEDLNCLSEIVKGFCGELKQECVLAVSNDNGKSFLHYLDKFQYIGKFAEISEEDAKAEDNYTYDPELDKYFIVWDF